jgi:TetR/AcrR family transcriptional regulator
MGITERKEREKEQRRNAIIDAAEKIFFTKGMDNSTMDDVAEEAELSKGTLSSSRSVCAGLRSFWI